MRLAIVGAGPAGIYAADLLIKAERDFDVEIDLFDQLPAPYGLVRYGEHIGLEDLKRHYHAVIFATGAIRDASLDIPGIDADASYGAADFVSWFDGHPDVPRECPLDA